MMKLADESTYTLMIEALQLLAEHEVLQDSGTSGTDLQTQLVLYRGTPVGGHIRVSIVEVHREINGRSHGVSRHIGTLCIGKGTGNTSSIGQAGNGQRKPSTSHFGNWIDQKCIDEEGKSKSSVMSS